VAAAQADRAAPSDAIEHGEAVEATGTLEDAETATDDAMTKAAEPGDGEADIETAADAVAEAEAEAQEEAEVDAAVTPERAADATVTDSGAGERAANDPRNRADRAPAAVMIEDGGPLREKPPAETAAPIPVSPPRRNPAVRAPNDPRARRASSPSSDDDQAAGGAA
jgi:hypothetical protein